jgi:signal transduction histidine kinase
LKEGNPIAFRWCPKNGGIPPATTDLPFREIATNAYAEQVERKPGDFWIDFPLFIGEQPYGKLTLAFSSESPPPARVLDDLNVISSILTQHLKRLQLDEARLAEMRSMQQRAIAVTAHDLVTRISSLPVFLADYRDLEELLTGSEREEVKRVNDLFEDRLQSAMDVLERAKLRLGEVRPTFAEFDLCKVLLDALNSVDSDRGGGRTEIVNPEADGRVMIDGDRSLITGVFLELISDSVTMQQPRIPVQVKIRVERRSDENRVIIDYTDNGPGVPDELKENIFEYLTSYRPGQTRKGLGLGLGFVRETIQVHSGSITEIGRHGHGVHFRIALPIKR